MDIALGRSPLSSAFVVSGLIHLGLIAFLIVRNFSPQANPTEIGLVGNFIQAQTPFAQTQLTKPIPIAKEIVKPRIVTKAREDALAPVDDVTAPAPATQNVGATGQSLTPEAVPTTIGAPSQGQYDEYTRDVLKRIHQKKVYPRMAQKMGHTGKIRVRLRIARDGSVLQSEVVEESRFSTLNEAARKLLNELGQLKPFPTEVLEKFWVFHVPIEYKL